MVKYRGEAIKGKKISSLFMGDIIVVLDVMVKFDVFFNIRMTRDKKKSKQTNKMNVIGLWSFGYG